MRLYVGDMCAIWSRVRGNMVGLPRDGYNSQWEKRNYWLGMNKGKSFHSPVGNIAPATSDLVTFALHFLVKYYQRRTLISQ